MAGQILIILIFIIGSLWHYFSKKQKLKESGDIAFTVIRQVEIDVPKVYTFEVHFRSGRVTAMRSTALTPIGQQLMSLAVNKDKLKDAHLR